METNDVVTLDKLEVWARSLDRGQTVGYRGDYTACPVAMYLRHVAGFPTARSGQDYWQPHVREDIVPYTPPVERLAKLVDVQMGLRITREQFLGLIHQAREHE